MALLLGWAVLIFQPRYVFLFAFAAAIAALGLLPAIGMLNTSEGAIRVLDILVTIALFLIVGALIVALRKWMRARKSQTEAAADAELARVRDGNSSES